MTVPLLFVMTVPVKLNDGDEKLDRYYGDALRLLSRKGFH